MKPKNPLGPLSFSAAPKFYTGAIFGGTVILATFSIGAGEPICDLIYRKIDLLTKTDR